MIETETKPALPDAFYQTRLISVNQALEYMGIKRNLLYRLLNDKQDPLPSVKIGKNRKFKLDKLMWWIEKHEQ